MTIWTWVTLATLLGGVLSAIASGAFALNARIARVQVMINCAGNRGLGD